MLTYLKNDSMSIQMIRIVIVGEIVNVRLSGRVLGGNFEEMFLPHHFDV